MQDNGNDGKLPQFNETGGAAWPWDVPWDIGEQMLQSAGGLKKVFYDPGTASRFGDQENFGNPDPPLTNLWDFAKSGTPMGGNYSSPFHIFGYVFAFSGTQSKLLASAQNTTIQPEKRPNPKNTILPWIYTSVSDRELIACATICSPVGVASSPLSARYNTAGITYTEVAGWFYLNGLSPHLNGRFPSGGNICFKDGHVTWRKFDDMSQQAASGQSFWW